MTVSEYRQLVGRTMSEADLDERIRDIAKQLRMLRYHTHDSRRSGVGFPDLVLVGERVLYRELKREGKYPTPAQREWLERLQAAGQDAGVWRPSDLLSGRILREMSEAA